MKRFFVKLLIYAGLWLEVASATCRWSALRWAKLPCEPAKWRSFVTVALVHVGFLTPPRDKPREFFQAAQRESIQRCLRVNVKALDIVRGKPCYEYETPRLWWKK